MVKLLLIVIIFIAPMAAVAADGQSDGGYVAPELSRPTPWHLLDKDYLTSSGATVRALAYRSLRLKRRSIVI